MWLILLSLSLPTLVALAVVVWGVRRQGLDRWLASYLRRLPKSRLPGPEEEVHVLLCIADHYEPRAGGPTDDIARARVERWRREYPRGFDRFADSDGRKPRHTFFFPAEEYEPEWLDSLAELCALGYGEVEIHLHHDRDTPDGLRRKLAEFRDLLAGRHGLLGRHKKTGEVGFAFIHGNWALCNPLPDGRLCGVDQELGILREAGCFVDMTMPSAPNVTQTSKINQIYYASDIPGRSCSHHVGVEVGTQTQPDGSLMLLQGPLVLDWGNRKWGLVPRTENACLQRSQPPTLRRLWNWLRAGVRVPNRPDWYFVKLHCHGATEYDADTVLGEPMARFHEELAAQAGANPHFHYHYVSAREMYNLARAAEAGWRGSVAEALDFEILPGPALLGPRPSGVDVTALERR